MVKVVGWLSVIVSYLRPPGGEWHGKTPRSAPAVRERHILDATVSVDPFEYFFHGLGVALTDVQLHLVHLVGLAIDLVPSVKALRFEVLLHRGELVAARLGHLGKELRG